MTDTTKENKPATVPEAKQAGETQTRWSWVEPTVWTERMLSALEEGVKGGKWYSLMLEPRRGDAARSGDQPAVE